jgi:hypothetical protein
VSQRHAASCAQLDQSACAWQSTGATQGGSVSTQTPFGQVPVTGQPWALGKSQLGGRQQVLHGSPALGCVVGQIAAHPSPYSSTHHAPFVHVASAPPHCAS